MIREAAAESENERNSSEAAADEEESGGPIGDANRISKRRSPRDTEAAALAAALQAAGYRGVDEAAVAAALGAGATEEELVAAVAGAVAQRAKEGGGGGASAASSSSSSHKKSAAAKSNRRSLSQFGANPLEQLLGDSPLGPLLPQPDTDGNARLASEGDRKSGGGGLLPLPPLPWNNNGNNGKAKSQASSATTVADAQLAAAVAIRPDTRCMLTSWDDVCAFIDASSSTSGDSTSANAGGVPADSPWRASGVCVPYSQPAPPAPASSTGNAGGLRISGK